MGAPETFWIRALFVGKKFIRVMFIDCLFGMHTSPFTNTKFITLVFYLCELPFLSNKHLKSYFSLTFYG